MLTKLQQFFDQYLKQSAEQDSPIEHRLQLASAALMVEVIHADESVSAEENEQIQQILKQSFDLDNEELASLLELANEQKHEATDYYHFTSLLNTHYTQTQKIKLVENLWLLAYADHTLDKFEEHLIRRLAELLHVPHKDFIRTKHKVLQG